jgi:hypothetical protein
MSEKRDYVKEAYETFVKNVEGLDPTDPEKAVAAYFEKNATDELKARCAAEGKTAKGCWEFIVAVARKVGGNCHIDPGAVYAMAMHYFEDVPVDWKGAKKESKGKVEGEGGDAKETGQSPEPQGAKAKKSKDKKAKDKKAKAKKRKGGEQGFFFELMEVQEKDRGEGSPRTEQEGGAE